MYRKLGPRLAVAARRGAVSAAEHSISILKRATDQKKALNYGVYKAAWKFDRLPDGACIFNGMPYAGIIERGRRPGARFPPKEAIVRWIQRKFGKSEKQARAMAFVVRRAIARRGLKPRLVLGDSMRTITKQFRADVILELDAELKGRRGT
jgi:hypothetical protein